MNKIVELRGLDKHYQQGELQVKAIDNVSLTIEKRDFAALCGPSGEIACSKVMVSSVF